MVASEQWNGIITGMFTQEQLNQLREFIKAEIEPVKQEIQKLQVKVDNLQLDVDAIRDAVIEEYSKHEKQIYTL